MKCTFCLPIILYAFLASAQEPLTNQSVIKMVQAGISVDVIVSVVKTQPAKYTLTPEELIVLKSVGVPDAVVAAMVEKSAGVGVGSLATGKSTGATTIDGTAPAGDPNDPLARHDSGIYLYAKDANGKQTLTILEQAAYQGSKTGGMFVSSMTYGIAKAKTKAVLPGKHAGIQTSEAQPAFYFYFEDKAAGLGKGAFGGAGSVSNPSQFALIRLDVTKSSRETVIGEFGAYGSSSGTNQKSMVAFKSEKLRPGLYKVTPADPMQPGEYCFLVAQVTIGASAAGAAGATQIFDFTVTSE